VTRYRLDFVYGDATDEFDEWLATSEWEVKSFSRRHGNANPYDYIQKVDRYGDVVPANVGIRRRLECGTAFVLSYYEHSLCRWALKGEAPNDIWDTAQVAGMLLRTEPFPRTVKLYSDRQAAARTFLQYYTDWCNGSIISCQYCKLTEDTESTEPVTSWEYSGQYCMTDEDLLFKDLETWLPADMTAANTVLVTADSKSYAPQLQKVWDRRAGMALSAVHA